MTKPREKLVNNVQVSANYSDWPVPGKSGVQFERILVSNDTVQAGQLKFCIRQWQTITSDKVILDIVKGYKLDFITMPTQAFLPQQSKFEKHEEMALNTLLEELIQ